MSDEVLKPCPFCDDGDCDTVLHATFEHNPPKASVVCLEGCGAIGPTAETEAEAIAAWNRRTDTALEALREARVMLTPLAFEEAEDLCERIDAIISGSPDYSEAVKELVRAARDTVKSYDAIYGISSHAAEALNKALAPFNEVK